MRLVLVLLLQVGFANPANALEFDFPLKDYLKGPFGQYFGDVNPDFCNKKGQHLGVDVTRPEGTEVIAVADGVVRYAREYGRCKGCFPADPNQRRGGWMVVVLIEHTLAVGDPAGPTVTSVYGHLSDATVSEDAHVMKGDVIGHVGNYPCSADHLHFAIYKGAGNLIDGSCGHCVGGSSPGIACGVADKPLTSRCIGSGATCQAEKLPSPLAGYACPEKFPGRYIDPTCFVTGHKREAMGLFAYVPNQFSGNVSVVDTVSEIESGPRINVSFGVCGPVDGEPTAIASRPDGKEVWVAVYQNQHLEVIDTATKTRSTTPRIPPCLGAQVTGVAMSPCGDKVYATTYGPSGPTSPGVVHVHDVSTRERVATVTVGNGPVSLVVTPDCKEVYVANEQSGTVSVIATSTYEVSTIDLGKRVEGLAVSTDGSKVYVGAGGSVAVINTGTKKIGSRITTCRNENGCSGLVGNLAMSPCKPELYIECLYGRTVKILNTRNDTFKQEVIGPLSSDLCGCSGGTPPASGCPRRIGVTPDGDKLYVPLGADPGGMSLRVIKTRDRTMGVLIPVGQAPAAVAVP
jgi:YVTN family beta-propeller protein